MKENIIKTKSFQFAVQIVALSQFLEEKRKYVLSRQLLKSGTSIGAMIRESEYAESTADFIHKLSIALKEANETQYWLELLNSIKYIDDSLFESMNSMLNEILKILTAIIKTSKQRK